MAAIIVSAGLGIDGEAERLARRRVDEDWARRFETEEWSALLAAWNALPVFGGEESRLVRIESDYDRKSLAEALRRWSPAVQAPLGDQLQRIGAPVLWVAGERDLKYVDEGRRAVERLPRGTLWIAPRCGHRVPWVQPQAFTARAGAFLETISMKGS
ncbi:MAG TPA: hypothetical protein VEZ11_13440 [Thermoanaerobaculia bacterium]|nr:hypothetical protein [Thermoanaerobaculia bacterium]